MYTFDTIQEDIKEIYSWLDKAFRSLRTGVPAISIFDMITISCYGSKSVIPHIASITFKTPQTFLISPYDKSLLKEIESEIEKTLSGVSVNADEEFISVLFSAMTTEQRDELKKETEQFQEQARVRIKSIREKVMKHLEIEKKEGNISEDELYRKREEVEKKIKISHAHIKEITEDKKKQISL